MCGASRPRMLASSGERRGDVMGLFGKLFSKETCAICGQEVGALKKRKLVDGTICKDCDDKLSPWFQTRSESTLAEIRSQLAMREQNKAWLEQFAVTQQFGEYGGVFIDDNHGWFCAVEDRGGTLIGNKGAVDGVEGLRYRNADVIRLADVIAVDDFVNESRVEVKGHDKDGKQVSYDPRHWRYSESFGLRIRVSHPYVSEMRVTLGTAVIEVEEERLRNSVGRSIAQWLLDAPELDLRRNPAVFDDNSLKAMLLRGGWEMPDYSFGFRNTYRNKDDVRHYAYLMSLTAKVRSALLREG